jgi:DNA-binding NtrC family response regulator
VIIMTAFGEVRLAVECMKAGAVEFLEKPIDLDTLLQTVRKWERRKAKANQEELWERTAKTPEKTLVAVSPAMKQLLKTVDQLAPTDIPVLITGESGTGKELLARRVHRQSHCGSGPFVALNCAALPEALLESELFGHEKGAFTGADRQKSGLMSLAEGGSLFLDELGELPLHLQPKLLRVIQEREFRAVGGLRTQPLKARLIFATNKNLEQEVLQRRFREDLFFRLNICPLKVPPLRERTEDIQPLCDAIFAQRRMSSSRLSPKALERLHHYHWPGNVRELENLLERAMILCPQGTIGPEELAIRPASNHLLLEMALIPGLTLQQHTERFQTLAVQSLARHLKDQESLSQRALARRLGIGENKLRSFLEQQSPPQ